MVRYLFKNRNELDQAIYNYDSPIGCAKCRKWPWDEININSDDDCGDCSICINKPKFGGSGKISNTKEFFVMSPMCINSVNGNFVKEVFNNSKKYPRINPNCNGENWCNYRGKDYYGDSKYWDLSNLTDLSYLFDFEKYEYEFYPSALSGISYWDTSNIINMKNMFSGLCRSNYAKNISFPDISKWDVSNVENMSSMFEDSDFNGYIGKWNISKVKDMSCMFKESLFNNDISEWMTNNVKNMDYIFYNSNFIGDITNWDLSNLENYPFPPYEF